MIFTNTPQVSVEEVKKAVDENFDILVVDVRTPEEYSAGKIKNSINIPLNNDFDQIVQKIPNKDRAIYLYCRSGARSTHAVNIMRQLDYKNVFNMSGGIIVWKERNFHLLV